MNWWNVLEISYDSDLKTIKRAYAKLLKIHNPEDDPEGYQNLREAYDKAVKYAKTNSKGKNTQESINYNLDENIINKVNTDENIDYEVNSNKDEDKQKTSKLNSYIEGNKTEDEINEDEQIKFKANPNIEDIFNEEQETKININEQISEFLKRLDEIYSNMSLRIDSTVWQELLNSDVIWNVYSFQIIEDEMFKFLINHKYLPADIWLKLNSNFNWATNELKLYSKYSKSVVDEVLENLRNPSKLKYDYLSSIYSEISDEYLCERQLAYEALQNKDYNKADKHLDNAYSLFIHDPELLRLMANYSYDFNKVDKALQYYQAAFEINNYDIYSALRIGNILFDYKCFSEAISYFNLYLSYNADDKLALNNISYCYYYNNDLIMARENFQRLLGFNYNNKVIKRYLRNIEAQLDGRHFRQLKIYKNIITIKEERKKQPQKQETKSSSVKYIVRVIITMLILTSVRYGFKHDKQVINNDTHDSTVQEIIEKNSKDGEHIIYKKLQDDETFKAMNTREDIKKMDYCINIKIYANDIQPLGYYKLTEKFNGKYIVSKAEIDNNNLQDKIENQLFMGTFDNSVMIFADNNCTEDNIKDGRYLVKGAISSLGYQSIIDIKAENNKRDFYWKNGGTYIDCSQKEIESVKKESSLMEMQDGKPVRVSKTLQDFLDNDYPDLQSIYLTDIRHVDVYTTLDKNNKFVTLRKNELSKENSADYTQAYVGKIDGKYVMFIDKNFAMNNLDSNNGCYVYGCSYSFKVDYAVQVPLEQGNNIDWLTIENNFLYHKDSNVK